MGYSSTSLSNGQPQREQARELCLEDSYGYSEMYVTTLEAAALWRKCCRELGWMGDPSSLQPYVYEAHKILKHLLVLEEKKNTHFKERLEKKKK